MAQAWVTGSTSDIGRSICSSLQEKGYVIVRGDSTNCDLRNEQSARSFVENLQEIPRVVVCCAGGNKTKTKRRPANDNCIHMSQEDLLEIFNKNMFTVLNTCRAIIPKMQSGKIILIGSNIVGHPRKNGEIAMYAMAKAAVHEYTLHLARALPRLKINCVAPDGTTTPEEVAKAVCYFSESEATGQILRLHTGVPWVN